MSEHPVAPVQDPTIGLIDACMTDLFEAAVERFPEAVAVRFEGQDLSYRALNVRANRLAHDLRRLGVGLGDRVALCAERGPEMVTAMLGVLKAGAAYVPLDPAYPAERLNWIVEDSGSRLVLTDPRWAARFEPAHRPVLTLAGRQAPEPGDDDNLARGDTGLAPSDLAYVIYTSGSTGRPKGVLIEHLSVVNLALHFSPQARVRPEDRVLQFASFSFDASISEIFPTLWAGATLVLRPKGPVPALNTFVDFLAAERISICDLPIALFSQWAGALADGDDLAPPDSLRQIVLGGEALDATALNRWFRSRPRRSCRIVHVYGPTEATVQVTAIEYGGDGWRDLERVPIGSPVPNTRIHLLDAEGALVGPGQIGEIYIGGAQVARGYLDRPDLTAERFVADPFSSAPGARLYRTGDLAQRTEANDLIFAGRVDSQVKMRGFRIELGEIEASLIRHAAVAAAAIVVLGADDGDPRLVAYFTLNHAGQSPPEAELRAHLAASLPDYMVPTVFVRLDSLPLTVNGKVDHKALPALAPASLELAPSDAPQSDLERLIAQIWRQVLNTDQVGRKDNFFQLGGHSLSLMRVLEALRRAGWALDVAAFYRLPTVAGVAAAVRPVSLASTPLQDVPSGRFTLSGLSPSEIAQVLAAAPGGADNVLDLYPLTPLQQGMLFHAVADDQADPYVIVSIARFDAWNALDAYVTALQAVVRRHDVFRTAFLWEGLSEPTQMVLQDAPLRIDEVPLLAGDISAQLMAVAQSPAYALDIRKAPLQRLLIGKEEATGAWWMASVLHHLIGDHASEQLIDAEIAEHVAGRADTLEPPVPFRAFIEHRRDALDPAAQEAFFKALLSDIDGTTAPFDCFETEFAPGDIDDTTLELEAELSQSIRAICESVGVSPAAFFHLAWALVAAKTAGRQDVVFGTVMLGRLGGSPGADRALGLFMNTAPFRFSSLSLAAAPALKAVGAALQALVPHEQASLALAQRSSGVAAPAPLFTSLLNYAHDSADSASLDADRREPAPGMTTVRTYERTNYPITLTIEARGGRHCLIVNAPKRVGARRLGETVQVAISALEAALTTRSDQPVGDLAVLTQAEHHTLVTTWNDTAAEAPADRCVHTLFEDQVARDPDAVAVIGERAALTYGQLNANANQLAHHLIALGVRPESRVAVCLERSPEMVVAILGILKSGAAYVPLDPAHPADRLRGVLADSGAEILVVCGPSPLDAGPAHGRTVIDLAQPLTPVSQGNPDPATIGVSPSHLAYVLYTSGSTGAPKGVTIEHRNVTNLATHYSPQARIGPNDRVMQFASYGFDVSVEEIFLSLWVGATVVLRPSTLRSPDASFVEFLSRQRISVAFLPTAFWHQWVVELSENPALAPPQGLRQVLVAGEKLEHRHLVSWRDHVGACRIINAYGPTEAAVATAAEFDAATPLPAREVPIGRPVANTTLYILDAAGQPAPIGVAGELYIGGVQVARGYLNRPDLTAERFIPDPFVPGGRLYKTGDLARYLPNGDVEYLGRNDFQVKIRGFRIELGEIEARLADHRAVREVVVLAREDQPGLKRLVTYYTPAGDEPASAQDLRAHILAALPEHMVPAAFVALPALPLTPNGKIDRKALPAPEGEAFAARAHQPPQGPTEQAIALAWSAVLGLDAIGRDDNFFELGGHSLLVVKVVNQLKTLAPGLTPVDLFRHQTLTALADHIGGLDPEAVSNGLIEPIVARRQPGASAPQSLAQQSLWFVAQAEEASQAYHIPLTLRLTGSLDVAALARALDAVVARHEALRTSFTQVDGLPVQIVTPSVSLDLTREILAPGEPLDAVIAQTIAAPFDLHAGLPIRARLVALDDQAHILVLVIHHIAADGWSIGVLQDELSQLYNAFAAGRPDPLAPLPIQYADYALWQTERLEGAAAERLATYWKSTLAGAPTLLNLPLDRPRPAIQDHAGGFSSLALDTDLSTKLVALAQRHGVTLHTVIMAAWALVLSRLSSQDDIVVGTPSAGRDHPQTHGLIGYFVNTLPVRIDLATAPTAKALFDQVQARVLAGLQHQDLSLPRIIQAAAPARDPAFNPLFQTLLTVEQAHDDHAWRWTDLEVAVLSDGDRDTAKVDLSLNLGLRDGQISGGIEYATALFDPATIDRVSGYLLTALQALAKDTDQPLAQVDLLSPAERRQLLVDWNNTAAPYPADRCIHELFEDQAAAAPQAVALVFEGQTLSYGELNARANQLAHHLIDLGVKAEVRVAICAERSPEMVIGLLAVLKAGGAYVPLDPTYPEVRLAYMLADSAPAVVLAHTPTLNVLKAQVPVLDLDKPQTWASAPKHDPDPARLGLRPEHLAYVIYTSGTTGVPKGVMNAHVGVVNRLAWMQKAYGFGREDRFVQKTPFSFDVSVWEFFSPLLAGARLVMARPEGHKDPDYLAGLIAEAGVTIIHFVPSMLAPFLDSAEAGLCQSLRMIVCSGEALARSTAQSAQALLPWARLHNLYGPTEAAVDVTAWTCEPTCLEATSGPIPIGRPIANTRIYILDEALQPVPIGVAGELHIGGVQVARGYLNRPDLTAERFIPDPFVPGGRLYKTGDLVRYLPSGDVEYLGRNDFQVKIRGFRIELGEIEARLACHPAVREVVVLAREDQFGLQRLVAYYTPVGGEEAPSVQILRAHLLEALPEHMVPAAFVVLPALPLTPNGKVDRKTLPEPAFATRGQQPPQGATEQAIAEAWCEILGLDALDREDNFFELGGHSLLVIRAVSRLKALGPGLSPVDLFRHQTLSALAAHIDGLDPTAAQSFALISPRNEAGPSPLSFAQESLWFVAQTQAASQAYHVPLLLRLTGTLDVEALQSALDRVVTRHEILRSGLQLVGGAPVQASRASSDLDLGRLSSNEADLHALIGQVVAAPFDLEAGPLIRATLLDLSDQHHVLVLVLHHIVCDGWSMAVLGREISELYAAIVAGRPDPLPALSIQYADYAFWQRERRAEDGLEEDAQFWKTALAGAPALLDLPLDRPRPAIQDHAGAFSPFALDRGRSAALVALARHRGVTLNTLVLAAWAVVLSRLSGQQDIVIGTPSAGRDHPQTHGLIGYFVNTLPLRVSVDVAMPLNGLIDQVHGRVLAALEHQDLSLPRIIQAVAPPRDAAFNPLFQTLLSVEQPDDAQSWTLPGLAVEAVTEIGQPTAKVDLTLSLALQNGQIRGGIEYATALFDASTIARFQAYLLAVFDAMAADGAALLGWVDILPDAERATLLVDWNATAADGPIDRCAHRLFEEQAARDPDAVAVVGEATVLTYGQLNARANQLARHLIGLGVQPDDRVALCLQRSPETIVAILATLKAGAAYVPLDPAHPAERLAWMLRDSGADILVATPDLTSIFADADARIRQVDPGRFDGSEAATNPATEVTPANLAYVIYTSGSTGQPKGVMVEHRNLTNVLVQQRRDRRVAADDRVLQFASYGFDISADEIFSALWVGAALVLRPSRFTGIDASFVDWLDEAGITAAFLPTAVWAQWATALAEDADLQPPLTLRRVMIGGEKADLRDLRIWREHAGDKRLINAYGPTEATIMATTISYDAATPLPAREVPIGRPVANTTLYILDAAGQPAPIGVAGELYIGGVQVARGYLNRPDLTAERFIPDPFVPGGRLYKTGDLARYLPNGDVEYLGRNDFQVKIRGFRIELGEIEARLADHRAVREVVVLAREDQPGLKRLVTYYTPAGDEPASAQDLRAHILAALPEHMVPAAFVALPALPLTPNGKIDRKALPAPEGEAFAARAHQPPQGPTEQAIALAWSAVLGLDAIGRDDNFFELGGHSLLVVKVVNQLKTLAPGLTPVDLFRHQTLTALADHIGGLDPEAVSNGLIEPIVARRQPGASAPQSLAQQSLWFVAQAEEASQAYHIPLTLRLTGSLDVAALARALDAVVARHEALRTSFTQVDGLPVQIVTPSVSLDLTREILAPGEPLDAVIAQTIAAPFDLHAGLPIRARLVALDDQAHILVLVIHHIAADGWSIGVLQDELSQLYNAFAAGRPDPLAPLPIQYADYALWQTERLEGAAAERLATYWKSTLAGAPTLLNLPLDRPRPAIQDHAGGFSSLALDTDLSTKLVALAQRHGVTLHTVIMAAWALVLSRLSSQDDIVVGTPSAGRDHPQTHGLIGYFVNTLPVRIDLATAPTAKALFDQVQARVLAGLQHQDLSLPRIIQAAAPARDPAFNPLFQTLLTVEQAHDDHAWRWTDLEVAVLSDGDRDTAKVDLSLNLGLRDGQISGGIEYATALFDPATIDRVSGYLLTALQALAKDTDQPLAQVDLLSPAERRQLLVDWNNTAAPYPADRCIHELFEDQAAAAPQAVALVFEGQTLSYGELNARANQLAHHLIDLGVKAEVRVAICAERSPEMVIGLLAVLKAGGAYVPLDPTYPEVRLAYMLADSAPRVILTSADLAGRFSAQDRPVLTLDAGDALLAHQPTGNLDRRDAGLTSEHLAYVIYTSGSTGRPKGVMVTHRNVLRLIVNGGYAPLTPEDCVAHCASPAFDAATWEIWGALLSGARLLIVPSAMVLAPERLNTVLAEGGVSALWLTSGLFNEYVDLLPDAFAGLRHLLVGGDVLNPTTIARLLASDHRPARLINGYGPTETTTFAATHLIEDRFASAGSIPIGRPIANTTLYILDAAGQPTPIGVAGELYIGGDGVARGYLNRPDLTAERFVPDPFVPGGRLYKTGDLARYLSNGDVEYLGRNDFQVKIRGFRIELGEIEARLADHRAVREVVVLAREDKPGLKRLVAYYTPAGDEPASAQDLRAHILAALPEHMVPAAFVVLPALPLTPNGKIDRNALPAPEGEAFAARAHQPPQGPTEQAIAQAWTQVLGLDAIGRDDNFFELGGHSLLVIKVVNQLKTLAPGLTPVDLFRHQTLTALAGHIDGLDPEAASNGPVELQRGGAKPRLFLVHDGGGQLMYAPALARALDPDRPVWGLPALPRMEDQTVTVVALAAAQVERLRTIQPAGPYGLGGHSFGGLIAYEMAVQLRAAGEAVAFVVMLDTVHLGAPTQSRLSEQTASGGSVAPLLPPSSRPGGDDPEIAAAYALALQASADYLAPPLDAPVHLMVARGAGHADPRLGWSVKHGLGDVQTHAVDGDHFTLLAAAHVTRLGQVIERALAAPEARIRGGIPGGEANALRAPRLSLMENS